MGDYVGPTVAELLRLSRGAKVVRHEAERLYNKALHMSRGDYRRDLAKILFRLSEDCVMSSDDAVRYAVNCGADQEPRQFHDMREVDDWEGELRRSLLVELRNDLARWTEAIDAVESGGESGESATA